MNNLLSFRQRAAFQSAFRLFSSALRGDLKKLALAFLVLAEAFGCLISDTPVTPAGDPLNLDGYELVFEDEFEGTELDTENRWEYRGNGKRFSGFLDDAACSVKNGQLVIEARYRTGADAPYGDGWYLGMLRTKQTFVRGYFEITCQLAGGDGFWSAFWLNSDAMLDGSTDKTDGGRNGAEIDIFESSADLSSSKYRNSVYSTVHVGGYGPFLESSVVGKFKVPDPYHQMNTYGLLWTEDAYIFYINGVESARTSFKNGVSQAEEFVILCMEPPREAVDVSHDRVYSFCVDSVRVYQIKGEN